MNKAKTGGSPPVFTVKNRNEIHFTTEQMFVMIVGEGGERGMQKKCYIAIDLKSFYASVECVERGLNPMTTNLVVADASRTEKTICLAVSPSLKARGIPGRARLFEVVQKVKEINGLRARNAPGGQLSASSWNDVELFTNPALAVDYIVAPPQMARYMEVSSQIYQVYLKYIAPEDIHVYSIDEVFLDATPYLALNGLSAHDFARKIIRDILQTTGITATAGIGTNLYLCKVAMDIMAKHVDADKDGVRVAELDEKSYRKALWGHRPLTDFWRVGKGYARKLESHGIFTMGDIARCSLTNEDFLYKLFGINAELLIDHAWGVEPCTIADIKAYRPESSSIGSGQVLQCPYTVPKARLVVQEMADQLALDLVDKGLLCDQIVLTVGYDIESDHEEYRGEVTVDRYGRKIPKHAHGSHNLEQHTASAMRIVPAAMELFDRIVDSRLLVRRLNLVANHVMEKTQYGQSSEMEQLDLFTDPETVQRQQAALEWESRRQQAILSIKKKFGKNAILKGVSLEEGATAIQRNRQIGGHKA